MIKGGEGRKAKRKRRVEEKWTIQGKRRKGK